MTAPFYEPAMRGGGTNTQTHLLTHALIYKQTHTAHTHGETATHREGGAESQLQFYELLKMKC